MNSAQRELIFRIKAMVEDKGVEVITRKKEKITWMTIYGLVLVCFYQTLCLYTIFWMEWKLRRKFEEKHRKT